MMLINRRFIRAFSKSTFQMSSNRKYGMEKFLLKMDTTATVTENVDALSASTSTGDSASAVNKKEQLPVIDDDDKVAVIHSKMAIDPVIDRYWMRKPLSYNCLALSDEYFRGLNDIQSELGVHFKTRLLLLQAFIHPSTCRIFQKNDEKLTSDDALLYTNDRLISFGQDILNMSLTYQLMQRNPQMRSSLLKSLKSRIMENIILGEISDELKLSRHLVVCDEAMVQHGYEANADLLKAFLGALYLDGGMQRTFHFIFTNIKPITDRKIENLLSRFK